MRGLFVTAGLFVALTGTLAAPIVAAQDAEQSVLKQFTRTIEYDGLALSVVHLNDKTVEILFQAPTKYAMRVRSNQATMFYVQGTPQKDLNFETTFTVEQNGENVAATAHNIKNFETKKALKGERMNGLIEVAKKIDVRKSFKLKNGRESVEFRLSDEALKMLN
jgi:hypothetical protein